MKKLILSELLLLFLATTFMTDSLPPGWYQQSIPIGNRLITDIYFLDSLNGWVVTNNPNGTDSSLILKTTDGANNWTQQFKYYYNFNAVQFVDLNTGYAGSRQLYKTTNGGNNWIPVITAGFDFQDVFFVNKDTGWICDADAAFGVGILKTTNGGVNWTQQAGPSYRPKKLFFINADTGWAGSNDSKLYRTTNSGQNWNLQYTFNNGLTDFFFINKDSAWAIAGETTGTGTKISTDGGNNWTSQNLPTGIFWGMTPKLFFINSQKGWAGISFNKILATTNSGMNWGFQTTPIFDNFTVFFVDTLTGWAGRTGIVKTNDGGGPISDVIQISNKIPINFTLHQNYPNPFNPSTKIKFDISKSSFAEIKAYDIQGKLVSILISENLSAGEYETEFNASGLSSGVYFYQLTISNEQSAIIYRETKKMLMIK